MQFKMNAELKFLQELITQINQLQETNPKYQERQDKIIYCVSDTKEVFTILFDRMKTTPGGIIMGPMVEVSFDEMADVVEIVLAVTTDQAVTQHLLSENIEDIARKILDYYYHFKE